MNDLLHKASTYVRDYCVANNINTVIVGDITGIRDGNDLGHVNNQAFYDLPYKKFTDMLSYKLAMVGVNLVCQREFLLLQKAISSNRFRQIGNWNRAKDLCISA